MVFQLNWSITASLNDYYYKYSAGKDIAEFIDDNELTEKKIYATRFWALAVLPYFENNIFITPNYPKDKP